MFMEEQLKSFPMQIKEALKINKRINLNNFDKIVLFGIGGSGCACSIFKDFIIDKLNIPIIESRNIFPSCLNKKTLVFIISYSGNTKEIIELYKKSMKKTKNIFILSSGGYLGKEKNVIYIPPGFVPRESTIFIISAILVLIGKGNYLKIFKSLKNFDEKNSEKIAKSLKNKIPVIYASSEKLRSVAYKWKINFNETSKIFAYYNFFTEINHNEIEAFFPNKFKILVITDKKYKFLNSVSKLINFEKIELLGASELEKIFYGILLGDYIAYHCAKLNKKNPLITDKISFLKNEI
jgi:glucose/mannose-6-phosphate isomerase